MDYLDLGAAPAEEPCAQLGTPGYAEQAEPECQRYIDQLRAQFGPEPAGAELTTKHHPHEFGTYLSVAVLFDPDNEAATAYAFACEGGAWGTWRDKENVDVEP